VIDNSLGLPIKNPKKTIKAKETKGKEIKKERRAKESRKGKQRKKKVKSEIIVDKKSKRNHRGKPGSDWHSD